MQWNSIQHVTICDNIRNLQDAMLSEISQTQKEKYCMIPLIYGI